jgi:phage gpG-like protein
MGVKVAYRPPAYAGRISSGIPETMKKAAAYLQSSADRKIKKGVPPPNSPLTAKIKQGAQTLRDSGDLAQSIAPHSGAAWADASTNKPQAQILQNGGTVKPKKARALWIPAGPRTRALMKTYRAQSPAALIAAMKADGYSFFKTPLSKTFCAVKGKRGKPFALFIIRSSVKIPARPFLCIDEQDEAFLTSLIRESIMKELKKRR